MTTELLAQVLEEISILASDLRRSEPKIVPRPSARPQKTRIASAASLPPPEAERPRMSGHQKMLAAAMQRGMIRSE
ncbi:hypothetical protein OG723_44200 (plasmid) [Streptomyces sp. NBC_01278]|uniref:hypothetical protein n=1 Tax=Streptomyces sp. NBC_01278 TaxID=2903809 RepID=UPI002E380A58|nr:hypothetical protein [Streptomyces sp. NBC_01278]